MGVVLKKGKVLKEGFNPKTGEHIPAVERSVIMLATFSMYVYWASPLPFQSIFADTRSNGVTAQNEALVTSKFANEVPHLFAEFKAFEY